MRSAQANEAASVSSDLKILNERMSGGNERKTTHKNKKLYSANPLRNAYIISGTHLI
jgi:hypothetical protein